ncbi:type II secretion system minor pseudopilin GspH [Dokdonella sp.]|uniref:type II secretion system minor pseudopilin GspH n=1 Tax=Dokdonella sp. TaxID=2291710 RepID=UPI0027BA15D7|nr:type II secretion system minor pseudopilin GspH [Dokdonella sp.]
MAVLQRSRLRSASNGFTLLEILVVVAIVAVLAVVLTLAVGGNAERQLDDSAAQFRARLAHACDEAELAGREIGVALGGEGYSFARLDGDRWQGFGRNDELRDRAWPTGLRVTLERDGRVLALGGVAARVPQVVCFSSGELTPFTLTLRLGEPALQRRLLGSADGVVSVAP